MRYRRLPVELYTNTLEAGTLSRQQNRYAHVFGHHNGWVQAMPMQKKSDVHQALSHLFTNDGVPWTMIMDSSEEQTQGDFRKKAREADCHIRQTEPYSP